MKIALFGVGFAGTALADELRARGHDLTVVARHPGERTTATGSVHDPAFVARVTDGADVVVSALPPLDDDGGLPASTAALVKAAEAAHARLTVVGSSTILPVTPGGPRGADAPGFPDWLGPRVDAHQRTLDLLATTTEPDWVYVAPGAEFGPHARGERTGRYRTSTTAQVVDTEGRSRIGVEDYAIAHADEIDRPTVHRGWLATGS